jgi:hypothetical protein
MATPLVACSDASKPAGVLTETDSPSTTQTTSTYTAEVCDGLDNNDNGLVDEGLPTEIYYLDSDRDGYGDPNAYVEACEKPDGYTSNADDCDDTHDLRWLGASDSCDGIDNDCDDALDEDHRAGWVLATMGVDSNVHIINPLTGASTIRTAITGLPGGSINSADALDANFIVAHVSMNPNQLVTVDACTGVSGPIGLTPGNLPGIAFGPQQVLYGVDVDNDEFVRIDETDATAVTQFAFGFDILNTGLAYDCTDELLYVADQAGQQIFAVDVVTGQMSGFQPTNVPFDAVGLEFDNVTRTLYASTGTELWQIDPQTGTGTFLSTLQVPSVNDLVLLPPCP